MTLVNLSFQALFNRECPFEVELKYSGKFKGYNANCKLSKNKLTFHLSKQWKEIGDEIKIGLIQELLVKMFKKRYRWKKNNTVNMELYEIFLKKVHLTIPKDKTDPLLEGSFHRLNEQYFWGTLDIPNLTWGSWSRRQLGSYDFGTDTVKISQILHPENASTFLLDYVMYHELLHKKLQFKSKGAPKDANTPRIRKAKIIFENGPAANTASC